MVQRGLSYVTGVNSKVLDNSSNLSTALCRHAT